MPRAGRAHCVLKVKKLTNVCGSEYTTHLNIEESLLLISELRSLLIDSIKSVSMSGNRGDCDTG